MIGAKMKIAILYDSWGDEVAPAVSVPTKRRKKKPHPQPEVEKEDREEIFEALQELGHEPSYYPLDGRLQSLHALSRCGADLVFNLTEAFNGDDTKDMNLAAYLELIGIPFTGSGPHAFFLAQDKAIAKKMFAFHGVRTPYFATSYRGRIDHSHDIAFPLIVKPLYEDGSIGIDADAVVHSVKELMQRVQRIEEDFDSPALIEEYIEGREIYAAILGGYEHSRALPLVELDFSRLPEGTPKIASWDVKFEKDTQAHKLTKSAVAKDLDDEMVARISQTALAAYRSLKLRDYGRIDIRLTPQGDVYVIEANPNPWLASKHEFAMAAKAAGKSYTQLIGEIVELAMARYSKRAQAQAQS